MWAVRSTHTVTKPKFRRLLMLFQNVIPAEVSLVCVVKPDEFWDKKVTHFCFWKEKDRLGFEVSCCPLSCHMTAYFLEIAVSTEPTVLVLLAALLGNLIQGSFIL